MATEFIHGADIITKKAAADIVGQRLVKLDANGDVVPYAALTDIPYGVALQSVTAGNEVSIIQEGNVRVEASAALAVGDYVGGSVNGRLVKLTLGTDTTKFVAGRVSKAASAAGVIVQASIDCSVPRTA
jgi:hypothetical protein